MNNRPMPPRRKQLRIVGAIRAGVYSRDQREDFRRGVRAALGGDPAPSVNSLASLHRAARAVTAASPAHDTRFGSLNRTLIARRV